MPIRTIGIISKPSKQELLDVVPKLLVWLKERSVRAILDRETASSLDRASYEGLSAAVLSRHDLAAECDLVVVLGGDGTLLAAARNVRPHNVPLLAVNLGSLGFLTAITTDELYPSLEEVFRNEHQIDERTMLEVRVQRAGGETASYHALNDAVLNKGAISRMLEFEASVDGQVLNLFRSDGLIVSTPTGSTAYGLSAGGPIVHPSVAAFIITPICSHALTNRPIVVSDRSRIEIVLKSEAESAFLTVDGQVGMALRSDDRIVCDLSPSRIRLVRPPHKVFFEVLRSKLKWG